MRLSSRNSRILCLILASVLALPVSFGMGAGLFLWTSPLLFLNAVLARRPLPLLSGLGFAALVWIVWRHRAYCRWLCPTGQLCNMLSRKRRRTRTRSLPSLGILGAVVVLTAAAAGVSVLGMLDPLSIFHAFFEGFRRQSPGIAFLRAGGLCLVVGVSFWIPRVWCRKLCPLGGLQDMVTRLKGFGRQGHDAPVRYRPARRAALGVLAGLGFGLLFKKKARGQALQLRPPGALAPDAFTCVCIRCGHCSKVCPTGIVRSSMGTAGWLDLLTPRLSFSTGYCLPACTACGRVCPSGAIQRFAEEDKKALVIGMARIRREQCLLGEQKECDRCRFYCPYQAISIRASDLDFNAWPHVHADRCVGCGACVAACPACAVTVEPAAHPAGAGSAAPEISQRSGR